MRHTKYITIDTGRDAGKTFLLTEMPCDQGMKWGARAVLALINAGVTLPDGSGNLGFAGLIGMAFKELRNGIKWDDLEPLVDDLMDCVKIVPNIDNKSVTRSLISTDIEEISTMLKLQSEVFKLHVNFMQSENSLD